MEFGEGEPASPTPPHEGASSPVVRRTGGTPADEIEPWPPADRPKDRLLWVWPVVVIALTAAAGQVLGPFGVLVAGVGTTGALALYLGSGWAGRVFMLASAVVLGVALTGILLGRSYDVISDDPAQERPSRFEAPRSSLVGVDLRDADLRGAVLRYSDLDTADLRGANLTGADLRGATLTDACLEGADLTDAILDGVSAKGAAVDRVVVTSEQIAMAEKWPEPDAKSSRACQSTDR